MEITINGLVIREKEFKGDRILLLLTEDMGLITAYAKGAKSPKSRFASSTELFCYTRFVLTDKGDKYWVDVADSLEVFFGLRSSIEKISLGSYICEITSILSPDRDNCGECLRLLLNCLKFLEQDKKTCFFIKSLFELRILTMSGFMPDLVGCTQCGKFENDIFYFSSDEGILLCGNCMSASPRKGFTAINMSVLSAMRHIIYSPFNKLFSFTLSDSSLKTLADISQSYLLAHIDFVPKTLTFLQTVL